MLIETDYLNYPPIRNNLTSASLLSMIIEMDYNLVGYKSHDRAALPRRNAAPEIYFSFPEALRGAIPYFFSLCHLQIVLLTIANTKIHYFYQNNDFNGDLTCVRGMKAPAAACRAVPLALVAVYLIFFFTFDYWNICPGCIFTRIHGTDDS